MTNLDIDQLTTIPGLGLFMNIGDGEYKSLDRERCTDFERFILLDDMWYDQLIATEDYFLIRNGYQIYAIDSTRCTQVAELDTPNFRLFAGNDSIFYFVSYNDSTSSIYSYNIQNGDATLHITIYGDIFRVEGTADGFIFITENSLYRIQNGHLHHLLKTEEILSDVVVSQKGILFCTETSLYIYDGEKVGLLANDYFNRLYYEGGKTYIILADGTVYRSDSL